MKTRLFSIVIMTLSLSPGFVNSQTWQNPSTQLSKLFFNVEGADPSIVYEIGRGFLMNSKYQEAIEFSDGGGASNLIIDGSGKVGIGTVTPSKKLTVLGNIGWGDTYIGSSLRQVSALRETVVSANMKLVFIADQVNTLDSDKRIIFGAGGTSTDGQDFIEYMRIDRGNVGIGTSNPDSKLAVNGKVHAKEIKVDTDWSDFVFEDAYSLPTLEEVEQHIQEKGHLKDIPSAKEVEENGIYLGEMDAKLLQKVEELTLYTIAQQKMIKEQQELLKQQEENFTEIVAELKKEIETIKNKK
ncbi:hypothetical protein OOZ15_11795 [Galbibacter sp. EGI 63066]|uniref:hypothetical protein n=1 Tax=Galbibacter sp. EGI 63066 TaxID=2993559 RepID=UPI002248A3C8|nr:hypothetical protein [Galbibacter sp. EGI 63066]MCX2680626.1 hypothetical protein [Galbibacter sp. EGI 63066]